MLTKRQKDKKTKRQKDKKTKRQKVLRCFQTCFAVKRSKGQMPGGEEADHVHAEEAKPLPPGSLSKAALHLMFSVIRRSRSNVGD